MMLMIRESTAAMNLETLLPLVDARSSRRFCFVSDDLHPQDIRDKGHLDHILRKAVSLGMDPVTAIQLVTLNPAEHFGLRDRGAVCPISGRSGGAPQFGRKSKAYKTAVGGDEVSSTAQQEEKSRPPAGM
jgi:adenine deaminase